MPRRRGGGHQLLVTAPCGSQDGERRPVRPAQGGEGHVQVPLPRQVQAPQGTAVPGTVGARREPSPIPALKRGSAGEATGGQTSPMLCGEGKRHRTPLAGWVFKPQSLSVNQFP